VSTSSTTANARSERVVCESADHPEDVLTKVGGASKEPLDDQPVLASDGDPQGTPHCIYENKLQSVTPSDVRIPLGWIQRMLRSRKRMGYCGATRAAGPSPTSSEKVAAPK